MVDREGQRVLLPINSIIVPIIIGIRNAFVSLSVARRGDVALPEPVCLSLCGTVSRPFPVDLVVDVAHGDDCSYHA